MVSEKNVVQLNAPETLRRWFVEDISAEDIKDAILEPGEAINPIEELISTAEAAFEFIKALEMEAGTKNAFWVLEREFEFWRRLVQSCQVKS